MSKIGKIIGLGVFVLLIPQQSFAQCTASGSNLDVAKSRFEAQCGRYDKSQGHDCDPSGSGWTCSTSNIGSSVPAPSGGNNFNPAPASAPTSQPSSGGACSVTGSNLLVAINAFNAQCGRYDKSQGHDCDPSGSGWTCSTSNIGSSGGSFSSTPTFTAPVSNPAPVNNSSGNSTSVSQGSGDGVVVLEAESTSSSRGDWIFSGGHIMFDGNAYVGAGFPPGSPLRYNFVPNRTGTYTLTMLVRRHTGPNIPSDHANDGFIRMEGDFTSPVSNPSTNDLRTDHKFFGGGTSFSWTGAAPLEIGGPKFAARYNLIAGRSYTFVLSGRSKGWSVDRIVLYHSSVPETVARNTSASATTTTASSGGGNSAPAATGNSNATASNSGGGAPVSGGFNKATDLLALQYDHAPDKDDGHAVVAGRVLADHFGVNAVMVHGAYGTNWRTYNSNSLAVARAAWGNNFINAVGNDNNEGNPGSDSDWNDAVENAYQIWKETLDRGGRVWVADGGQHDFTADVVRLIRQRMPSLNTRARIINVQHSNWNLAHTTLSDLQYLAGTASKRPNPQAGRQDIVTVGNTGVVDFRYIANGNVGGNASADLNGRDDNFVARARSSKFGGAWNAAFNYLNPFGNAAGDPKLDFSDTVEALYILGVPVSRVANARDFADEFF